MVHMAHIIFMYYGMILGMIDVVDNLSWKDFKASSAIKKFVVKNLLYPRCEFWNAEANHYYLIVLDKVFILAPKVKYFSINLNTSFKIS